MDGSAGRPQGQMNVLGSPLASCSHDPVTGFFRDGCCNTSPSDPPAFPINSDQLHALSNHQAGTRPALPDLLRQA